MKDIIDSIKSSMSLLLLVALVSVQSACDQQQPSAYKIPKETKEPMAMTKQEPMQTLPGMEDFNAQASNISYQVPEEWNEFPPSSVRKANFKIDDTDGLAEVSITVFPGNVGGYLANVNRWRQQIQLPPIEEAALRDTLTPIIISNHQGYYSLLEGSSSSIMGAILQFHGVTWFVKMQGSILTVQNQKENFLNFISSLEIEDNHH